MLRAAGRRPRPGPAKTLTPVLVGLVGLADHGLDLAAARLAGDTDLAIVERFICAPRAAPDLRENTTPPESGAADPGQTGPAGGMPDTRGPADGDDGSGLGGGWWSDRRAANIGRDRAGRHRRDRTGGHRRGGGRR